MSLEIKSLNEALFIEGSFDAMHFLCLINDLCLEDYNIAKCMFIDGLNNENISKRFNIPLSKVEVKRLKLMRLVIKRAVELISFYG